MWITTCTAAHQSLCNSPSVSQSVFFCRPHTILGCIVIFCIFRVILHVHPSWDWGILQLENIIRFKFSDISVVIIISLMSIMCTCSCVHQCTSKPTDQSYQTLFYYSLFGKESQVFKSIFPTLALITLPISLCYLVTMVLYMHQNWEIELPKIFPPLQIYPAIF